MPVTLTKTKLEKLLAAERMKTRAEMRSRKPDVKALVKEAKAQVDTKHRNSRFMRRTGSIYNGMKKRAAESKVVLPFNLADLRVLVDVALGTQCPYGGGKISIANFAVDHAIPIARSGSWQLSNLVVSTTVGNFRKGQLTAAEWIKFDRGVRKHFAPEAVTDIFRRLSLGGKWSFGK